MAKAKIVKTYWGLTAINEFREDGDIKFGTRWLEIDPYSDGPLLFRTKRVASGHGIQFRETPIKLKVTIEEV